MTMKNRFLFNLILAGMLLGNPVAVMSMEEVPVENEDPSAQEQEQICAICTMEVEDARKLGCNHSHCAVCLQEQLERALRQWQNLEANLRCPTRDCNHVMNEQDIRV